MGMDGFYIVALAGGILSPSLLLGMSIQIHFGIQYMKDLESLGSVECSSTLCPCDIVLYFYIINVIFQSSAFMLVLHDVHPKIGAKTCGLSSVPKLVTMASNLIAMASTLVAMASSSVPKHECQTKYQPVPGCTATLL